MIRSVTLATLAVCTCILSASGLHAQVDMQNGQPKTNNAQSAPAMEPDPTASPTPAEAKPPFVGRLPRYFSKVVSPEQRQTIYEIQHSFRAKIEKLQQELNALKAEQNEAVEAVLSKVQLQQVMALRKETLASRASPERMASPRSDATPTPQQGASK